LKFNISFSQAKGTVEKVPSVIKSARRGCRRDPAVGGMAVLLEVRTGIHPEGFILKDKPCPYVVKSLNNGFFNRP
jgi:hypothetical protein